MESRSADPNSHVAVDAGIPAPAAVTVIGVEPAAPETDAAKAVVEMSAAMVSADDVGVAATPTAAAATEASMTSVSAAMSTSMAAAMSTSMSTSMSASMPTPMAAATSAGGHKRWARATAAPSAAVAAIAITVFRDIGALSSQD